MKAISTLLLLATMAVPASAENHALLVGVSSYPQLGPQFQLHGPANDVRMMRELLKTRGFADNRVVALADGVEQAAEPTRANILAAMGALAQQAKAGDFIYLHFGGHGSQQPAMPGKVPAEPDGKDEIFLPRDIGKWNGTVGKVDNAVLDSEMNTAILAMRAKGAFVWAVFDSCHSGTMTRGGAVEGVRYRKLRAEDLGVPEAAFNSAAVSRGGAGHEGGALGEVGENSVGTGGFVAFYAAQTVETTPEMPLPAGMPGRVARGLFSYVLADTLANYQGISYRQLGQQVLQRYAALGMNSPTPLFEGTALDAPVFGTAGQRGVRQWPLQVQQSVLSVEAGAMQQFGEGAVFALVPTAASPDSEVIGYLAVSRQTALSSTLAPLAYEGKSAPAMDAIKAGQYLRLVAPNVRLSLRIAMPAQAPLPRLDPSDPPSAATNSKVEANARKLLQAMRAKPLDGLDIEWVEAGQPADLQLRLSDDKLWTLGPDGLWKKSGPDRSFSIALVADQQQLASTIGEHFRRVAKFTNLLKVAGSQALGGAQGLQVKTVLVKATGGARVPLDGLSVPELRDGDRLEFVFHNPGKVMLDLTALYLDSEYGITAMYPTPGRLNRIEAGATDTLSIDINADTTGTERMLLIAVPATPQAPNLDLSYLAQPKLERSRGGGSPVDLLLRDAAYQTRGATARVPKGASADFKLMSWRVVK